MPTAIDRRTPVALEATFGATLNTSTAIPMANLAGFAFNTAATGTPIITWHASESLEGVFRPVILSNGNAATTQLSGARVYIAPPELFACTWIKGVSSAGSIPATVMAKT